MMNFINLLSIRKSPQVKIKPLNNDCKMDSPVSCTRAFGGLDAMYSGIVIGFFAMTTFPIALQLLKAYPHLVSGTSPVPTPRPRHRTPLPIYLPFDEFICFQMCQFEFLFSTLAGQARQQISGTQPTDQYEI